MAPTTNVLELLNSDVENGRLSTGCREFDEILNGGFEFGKITEVYGEAGSGKTQLLLQLAVSTAARGRTTVLLDTEGKVCANRIKEIVTSGGHNSSTMDRILVRQVRSQIDLVSIVKLLPALLQDKGNVGVILIDSVAQHFRFTENKEDLYKNPGVLYGICETLNELAFANSIAVVISNQVTTHVPESGPSSLLPALGEAWRYAPTTRIRLKHPDIKEKEDDFEAGLRLAFIEKSSGCELKSCKFMIRGTGIGDP